MKKKFKDLERRQRIKQLDSLSNFPLSYGRPSEGWVRLCRKALGMTMAQLAQRLGVQQSRIAEIEKTEVQDQLTLKTLRAAAQAVGCRFEYVFIPEEPLETLLKKRAVEIARKKITYISHQMALENQELNVEEKELQVQQLAEELLKTPQKLWQE